MEPLRVVCQPINRNREFRQLVEETLEDIGRQVSFIQAADGTAVDLLVLEPSMTEWTWLHTLMGCRRATPQVPVILFSFDIVLNSESLVSPAETALFLANDAATLKGCLSHAVPESAAARKRVLFVDDDTNALQAYQRLLHKTPWNIVTAGSADEAMDVLRHKAVDLIVTDIKMPGIHGLKLISNVREKYHDIPIVICSGYQGMREDYDLHLHNVAAFLEKPVVIKQLQETIATLLA